MLPSKYSTTYLITVTPTIYSLTVTQSKSSVVVIVPGAIVSLMSTFYASYG